MLSTEKFYRGEHLVNVKFGGSCKSLVLLEVVDGGEGTLVWHKEGEQEVQRGEGGVDQGVCDQCQEERRAAGSGWLATPTGCRLLAQVKPSLKIFPEISENQSKSK